MTTPLEERVLRAANEFDAQGITPTVRAVLKAIGGGNTAIANRALREWREQRSNINNFSTPTECPDELKRAFTVAVVRLTNEATQALQSEVQYCKRQEAENQEHFEELEHEIASTKELLAQEQDAYTEARQRFEREVATLQERNAALEGRVKELEKDLAVAREQEQLALTERAKAELERDTIKEAAKQAQQLHGKLQEKYSAIRDEKEALKVHNEHLQTQLADLEKRYQEEKTRVEEERRRAQEFLTQSQALSKQLQEQTQALAQDYQQLQGQTQALAQNYQTRLEEKQRQIDQLREHGHQLELKLQAVAPGAKERSGK